MQNISQPHSAQGFHRAMTAVREFVRLAPSASYPGSSPPGSARVLIGAASVSTSLGCRRRLWTRAYDLWRTMMYPTDYKGLSKRRPPIAAVIALYWVGASPLYGGGGPGGAVDEGQG